jgi:glutathione S-transferase
VRSASEEERDGHAEALVAAVVKEVEPLLADTDGKGPFFGGNEKITLAEVRSSPRDPVLNIGCSCCIRFIIAD